MPRELRAHGRGARQAAEKAGPLPRQPQRLRMLLGERSEVDRDRRRRPRLPHALRGPGQAVRAVAARAGQRLAEVTDERLHLTALVLDQREHAPDTLGLGALTPLE